MPRIWIKETSENDYESYYIIRSSPADIYWNGYDSKPDYNDFKKIFLKRICSVPFNKPEDRRIFLVQNENKKNIGFTQLILHEDCIEIGYSIIEEYQKQGYATEALLNTIPIARNFKNRVIVQIRDDNIASQKVAYKCGFVKTNIYHDKDYPKCGIVKLRTYELNK